MAGKKTATDVREYTEEVTVDWLSRDRNALDRDGLVDLIDDALVALVAVATGTPPDLG